MSQRVTPDDLDPEARLRPPVPMNRPPMYIQRGSVQLSRKLFQDVSQLQSYDLAGKFAGPEPEPVVVPTEPTPITQDNAAFVTQYTPQTTQTFVPKSFAPPAKQSNRWLRKLVDGPHFKQRALTGVAALLLLIGGGIGIASFRANGLAHAQAAKAGIAAAIPATTTGSTITPPSTAQVTSDTLRSYHVAPDMARYLSIPRLGVLARVLSVGTTSTGVLATPTNVFDAAWYKDSARPGQPGASLINGHVSSGATKGVFYGIKNLVAGDNIEIERGDGTKLEYTVVKTTACPKNAVDIKALQQPVTARKSGLNLMTCGGKYDASAGDFTQRIAVFATLNN